MNRKIFRSDKPLYIHWEVYSELIIKAESSWTQWILVEILERKNYHRHWEIDSLKFERNPLWKWKRRSSLDCKIVSGRFEIVFWELWWCFGIKETDRSLIVHKIKETDCSEEVRNLPVIMI